MVPAARPRIATSAGSGIAAMSPTVCTPRAWSLAAVLAPTPQTRSIGNGWRNASSPSGGTTSSPSGFDTALATLARNFVRATPTLIGRSTRSRTSPPQPDRDLLRRAGDPPQAADVEERLVDRDPLDERRGVVEDVEHRPARLGVGGQARLDEHGVRAQPLAPRRRPSRRARRTPGPRSWRAITTPPPTIDRPPAQRAGCRAARPRRRTRRGRRGGSSPRPCRARTYVRKQAARASTRQQVGRRPGDLVGCLERRPVPDVGEATQVGMWDALGEPVGHVRTGDRIEVAPHEHDAARRIAPSPRPIVPRTGGARRCSGASCAVACCRRCTASPPTSRGRCRRSAAPGCPTCRGSRSGVRPRPSPPPLRRRGPGRAASAVPVSAGAGRDTRRRSSTPRP